MRRKNCIKKATTVTIPRVKRYHKLDTPQEKVTVVHSRPRRYCVA